MRVCKKCGTIFPNRMLIDGKQRVLNRRKFCITCSPFRRHNTQDLTKSNDPSLVKCVCPDCDRVYIYKRFSGHTKTRCNSCHANRRRFGVKKWAVAYKGGECVKCGYNRCISALHFHHLNPSKKDFTISGAHTQRRALLAKELDKCVLLCANCHAEAHAGLITFETLDTDGL